MTMNIACATDNHYAPYCGIMLTSLFENNKEHSFSVYILTRGLSEENTTKFNSLASKYHSIITMIELDNETFKSCPIKEKDPISIVAYYRLVLPFVLPIEIQKVLYLDVDIIVDKQIDTLYNTDVNNVALAACIDYYLSEEILVTKIDKDKKNYFNSGVLLINLDYWRHHQIAEQCFDFIEKNPDKLLFWDQDALNAILQNTVQFMDISYNFISDYLLAVTFEAFPEKIKQSILQSAYNPTIIHFAGKEKPWNKISDTPYKSFYLYYKRRSLWADSPQISNYPTLRYYLGWYRRRLYAMLGFMKPRFIIMSIKRERES